MGERTVKNIKEPVRVYRMLIGPDAMAPQAIKAKARTKFWQRKTVAALVLLIVFTGAWVVWNFHYRRPSVEPASIEKMSYPLPDKPSIAVLPFVNMSGDPKHEYIADGITENITTALSKIKEMFVIARSATITYKGKPIRAKRVSENFGVRYVLEGSVLKEGDQVRITAQLVDAIKGRHLWAEKYDRDMKSVLGFLDEMTKEIVTALQIKLTWGEFARYLGTTNNFEAWDYHNQAISFYNRPSKVNYIKALELAERATKLDPKYMPPLRLIAWIHIQQGRKGLSRSPQESMKQAVEFAQKAYAIDESDAGNHALFSRIYQDKGQYKKAIASAERAIELDPNYSVGYIRLSILMKKTGRIEEAIELNKAANRLYGPNFPANFLFHLAGAYYMAGNYEAALVEYKKLLERSLKGEFYKNRAHKRLAKTYRMLGQEDEARKHEEEASR